MAVTILNLKVEKYETYIFQLQIMQKPEIVHLFVRKRYVVLAAIFCFSHLKVKGNIYRTLSDWLPFSTPELCKKCIPNYSLKCRAKFNVSDFSPG